MAQIKALTINTVILECKMSKNTFVFFAIDQSCKQISDAPNHVLKRKYDVKEHPAVIHMIK